MSEVNQVDLNLIILKSTKLMDCVADIVNGEVNFSGTELVISAQDITNAKQNANQKLSELKTLINSMGDLV